jgi:hypothetical protein
MYLKQRSYKNYHKYHISKFRNILEVFVNRHGVLEKIKCINRNPLSSLSDDHIGDLPVTHWANWLSAGFSVSESKFMQY